MYSKIENYPDYAINKSGYIISYRRYKTGKKIKGKLDNKRRYRVTLVNEYGPKRLQISRLVYKAFKGPLVKGLVIDHIDNDPTNNHVDNLQQITIRQNLTKDKINYTSKYPGVNIKKSIKERGSSKYWIAGIRINGKRKHLGCFHTEIEAAEAYAKALKDID